jgi:CBS-domain-containing membrane protein
MHVTPFSAATILVFATASPLHAQGIEVFGGYSVNADYVQNRPAILVVDQKVSPFGSEGGRQRSALSLPLHAANACVIY